MNWIEEMIVEQCPNGVKKAKLGDAGDFYNGVTGKNKNDFVGGNATFITYMNVYNNPSLKTEVEDKVVIAEGEKQNTIEYGDCLFTTSSETPEECGMSSVLTHKPKTKLYLNSFCFGYRFNDLSSICPAFYSHLFRSNALRLAISKTANGVTRFNVSKKLFGKISIPLPPLSIQKEIVSVLDKFSELIEKTDEEIALRQKQYEYYREKLLTFEDGEVEWKKLGEVCEIKNGKDYKHLSSGNIPVWGTGGIMTYVDTYAYNKPSVLLPRKGTISKVYYTEHPFWTVDTLFYTIINIELIQPRYLYDYMSTINLEKYNTSVGNRPSLTQSVLNDIEIPIPSLSRQQEIVVTLDKFEALISKLKEERELRQKQYEYYREKLLTF